MSAFLFALSFAGELPVAIAAPRGGPAPSRRRGDSSPGMMDVGGFSFDFEPFRTASRSFHGATGETSRTAPESGLRGARRRGGRHSMRRRSRRAPGRLVGQPRGPRAVSRRPRTGAVGVVALRSARTASRGSERSTPTPSARRVRRRASPRLCCCRGMQSLAALLVKQSVGSATWPRCDVLPAPLRLSGDRCGSVDSIALSLLLLSVLMP